MRLWPYQMLDVLPARYILSQWRECLAVSGIIASKKSHYIIDRVKDYDISHFIAYVMLVQDEFKKRSYTIGTNAVETLDRNIDFSREKSEIKVEVFQTYVKVNGCPLFQDWHNERYIKQCLHSFQEKYDCKGITEDAWCKIQQKFSNLINK